jgi:hypothetical protein
MPIGSGGKGNKRKRERGRLQASAASFVCRATEQIAMLVASCQAARDAAGMRGGIGREFLDKSQDFGTL